MRGIVKGGLEDSVRRWWRGEAAPAGALLQALAVPMEWGYRSAVALRNRRYDRRGGARVEGLRVVSVGNLALGGTGKTPVAAWAARLLQDAGWRPALLARGYGRDEVLLHQRWNPRVPVAARPDRVAAAMAARASGARAVVLDDGFQHRALARDVDMVLLAAEDGLPGPLLPRGPFREPTSALARAGVAVVTRRVAGAGAAEEMARRLAVLHPHLLIARVAFVIRGWQRLDGTPAAAPVGPTLAAAAVAVPERFAAQVEAETGEDAELLTFPDHHEFTASDVKALRSRAGKRTVVVTEKDAVKLQRYQATLGDAVRVLSQALQWEAGEAGLTQLVTATKEP